MNTRGDFLKFSATAATVPLLGASFIRRPISPLISPRASSIASGTYVSTALHQTRRLPLRTLTDRKLITAMNLNGLTGFEDRGVQYFAPGGLAAMHTPNTICPFGGSRNGPLICDPTDNSFTYDFSSSQPNVDLFMNNSAPIPNDGNAVGSGWAWGSNPFGGYPIVFMFSDGVLKDKLAPMLHRCAAEAVAFVSGVAVAIGASLTVLQKSPASLRAIQIYLALPTVARTVAATFAICVAIGADLGSAALFATLGAVVGLFAVFLTIDKCLAEGAV